MTEQAVAFVRDPQAWLNAGDIALPAAGDDTTVRSVRPMSILPSQLPPLAHFGPPHGFDRLPIEEVI